MNEIIESKKIWPRNTKLQIYRHAEMWDILKKNIENIWMKHGTHGMKKTSSG